jgi:hypothetical protein
MYQPSKRYHFESESKYASNHDLSTTSRIDDSGSGYIQKESKLINLANICIFKIHEL